MVYLFFFLSTITFLAIIEENMNLTKFTFFTVLFFSLLYVYSLQALQFNVGTDYFTYKSYYTNETSLELYFRKGEFLFYYLYLSLINFSFGEQSIFYVSAIILMLFLWLFCIYAKCQKVRIWLVIYIFLFVTGIYHNQMNGLRNQLAIALFPIIFVFLSDRKWFFAVSSLFLALFFHASSVIGAFLFVLRYLYTKINFQHNVLKVFVASLLIYMFLPNFINVIVGAIFPRYVHYINSSYAEPVSLFNILTKLYYAPLLLISLIKYRKETNIKYVSNFFSFGMFVFCCTYWVFITMYKYGFMFRAYQMFVFFYIFPIYYLLENAMKNKKIVFTSVIFTYLSLPYFFKTLIIPKGEYLFQSYIFNY